MKLLTLIVLLISTPLLAQEQRDLLNESFDDNSRNWSLVSEDDVDRRIENGKFYFTTRLSKHYWTGTSLAFNKKKNLRCDMTLSITRFKKGFVGMMWGGSDDYKSMYGFAISADGTFNFFRIDPLFQSITGSLRSTAINKEPGAVHKLSMVKEGNKLRLLINDQEVYSGKFPSPYGNHFGMVVGNGALTAEIDSLVVTEIDTAAK